MSHQLFRSNSLLESIDAIPASTYFELLDAQRLDMSARKIQLD